MSADRGEIQYRLVTDGLPDGMATSCDECERGISYDETAIMRPTGEVTADDYEVVRFLCWSCAYPESPHDGSES